MPWRWWCPCGENGENATREAARMNGRSHEKQVRTGPMHVTVVVPIP